MSELPRGWAEADLMEIVELHDAARVPLNKSERSTRPGPYPYYGANGLVDHINDYLFDGEYVLLAEDGGNFDVPGKPVAYRVDGKFWVNNHAHIMRPKDSIPASFLLHWCNQWNWMPFVGGTTRLKLTQEGMRKVRLALPPLAEQKRIVAKLDALNAKSARARSELTRIETLASRYKQAVLNKAFSGQLTSNFERGTSLGQLDTDAEVTQLWSLPETWSWCRTDQIGRVGLGRQRSPKNHEGPQMRPYLRSANITWQGVDTSDVKKMNFDDADFERFKLEVGDVLLNEGSGSAKEVGKPAIWRGEIADCCYQNTLLRVQPHRCSSEYAYYYFLLTARAGRFVSSTQGVNIQHIGREGLACYPFPLAPEREQHEIVARIETAFARIDRLAKEAKRALELVGRLDEEILAKGFRGELVPQNENDEPADKLLERINAERAATPKAKRKSIRRKSTMPTAKTFLNEKMRDWPEDGISFQKLRAEFSGSYDDLKEAVFSSLSDEEPMLQQVFDDKNSTMTLRKRGR